jgi:hypothetical protein
MGTLMLAPENINKFGTANADVDQNCVPICIMIVYIITEDS